MFEEKLEALSQVMAEHMAMPFPPSFRGLGIEDQDMVMLDADACGYALGVLRGR
ncbi:hypothetical protein [Streptomyces sp. NBC_01363]|uniref:hypothetical protein n=1 Tax=Streptomyces sp. NBC_01363 TaxID=2903840 RepID=UPI0022552779|nr:hypothetical protein [Streptomyces sp. NBC_01363]MCX4729457.1 hypothetical protein [Streptomyces sp. NBC_01363]MCX4736897.1 hypothetical protein [Streptomyces sp. NBC_01363]